MAHERLFHHGHAHKLDDPDRLKWLPPERVLEKLELRPGMRVADVGAGTGAFALPIARAGSEVFAVDMQKEMLDELRKRIQPGDHVTPVLGEATKTTLEGGCVDLVFFANVWHEIDDHAAALREVARILVPGGRIAIVDWRRDVDQPKGPPMDHRIAAIDVAATLERHGWKVDTNVEVGDFHYLVRASR